jgi:hypothetical protein
MRRRSKLSSRLVGIGALASLAGAACLREPIPTALELPSGPRRPDGVTIDVPPALPSLATRAPAEGVVALKEGVSDATIRAATDAFFDAFAAHDAEALERSLSRSARHLDAHGGSSFQVLTD